MSSAALTLPPTGTARLVVDTDVTSYVFKWHVDFAPRYLSIIRGSELVLSFMTLAEMRRGALNANWGRRKCDRLEAYPVKLTSADYFANREPVLQAVLAVIGGKE